MKFKLPVDFEKVFNSFEVYLQRSAQVIKAMHPLLSLFLWDQIIITSSILIESPQQFQPFETLDCDPVMVVWE